MTNDMQAKASIILESGGCWKQCVAYRNWRANWVRGRTPRKASRGDRRMEMVPWRIAWEAR